MADLTHITGSTQIEKIRHSLSHVMTIAVLEQHPKAGLGVGPAIEDGFYQDYGLEYTFTPEDLPKLEKRMRELITQHLNFTKVMKPKKEVLAYYQHDPFKSELTEEFYPEKDAEVQLYETAGYLNLCKGGHVENTKEIPVDGFKLTTIAGSYWRGDVHKPQLQRIYGVAFGSKAELQEYEKRMEEAEKRDHRKLGQELDLYSFHSVAPGAVFWHGNGMILWNELEELLMEKLGADYQWVQTPLMVKPDLFTKSGHLKHFAANMFRVENPQKEEFYLKPMNCPESTLIYASRARSYRDLPIRLAEIGRIHRNELSGTLGGLFRVRQITQDDSHIYCRPDQLEAEITKLLKLSKEIYELFGIAPSYFLSTKPDDAMGDPKLWEKAEKALAQALKNNGLSFEMKPKEGTFYAPKIDIDITDAIGRRWQLCTIQADLTMVPNMPGVEYTDEHGKKVKPVVIHRAIFGSFERFIGIITEHFAGAFPLWLAPVQVALLPVSEKFVGAAKTIQQEFSDAYIRALVDETDESVGKKIRAAVKQKVPYVLVIGEKEAKGKKVAVRKRGEERAEEVDRKKFIASVQKLIAERSREV